jgi:hypothetical protein
VAVGFLCRGDNSDSIISASNTGRPAGIDRLSLITKIVGTTNGFFQLISPKMNKFFLSLTILAATLISSVADQAAYNGSAGAGRTTFSNENYTMVSSDRHVASRTTTFTSNRTVTLPAANSLGAGQVVYVGDDGGAITSSFTLSIARAGSDTIEGGISPIVLTSARSSVTLESDGSSNWMVVARHPCANVVILTRGRSYAPSVGARALWVECIGGGGGGGGVVASPGNCAVTGGGGGGGYAAVFVRNVKTSYTYAVGRGGAGGASTGGRGGSGGNTTFDSPSICTATGGMGGVGMIKGSTAVQWAGAGGSAGVGTVGDMLIHGSDGDCGMRTSSVAGKAGSGGASILGGGVQGPVDVAAAGNTGATYGGGGSGGISISTIGYTGGPGGPGVIRITEYF